MPSNPAIMEVALVYTYDIDFCAEEVVICFIEYVIQMVDAVILLIYDRIYNNKMINFGQKRMPC